MELASLASIVPQMVILLFQEPAFIVCPGIRDGFLHFTPDYAMQIDFLKKRHSAFGVNRYHCYIVAHPDVRQFINQH